MSLFWDVSYHHSCQRSATQTTKANALMEHIVSGRSCLSKHQYPGFALFIRFACLFDVRNSCGNDGCFYMIAVGCCYTVSKYINHFRMSWSQMLFTHSICTYSNWFQKSRLSFRLKRPPGPHKLQTKPNGTVSFSLLHVHTLVYSPELVSKRPHIHNSAGKTNTLICSLHVRLFRLIRLISACLFETLGWNSPASILFRSPTLST